MPLPIPDWLSSHHKPKANVLQFQATKVSYKAHVMKRERQAHHWQLLYPCCFSAIEEAKLPWGFWALALGCGYHA